MSEAKNIEIKRERMPTRVSAYIENVVNTKDFLRVFTPGPYTFYTGNGEDIALFQVKNKEATEVEITTGYGTSALTHNQVELMLDEMKLENLDMSHTYLVDNVTGSFLYNLSDSKIVRTELNSRERLFSYFPPKDSRKRLLVFADDGKELFTVWGGSPLLSILLINRELERFYNEDEDLVKSEVNPEIFFIIAGMVITKYNDNNFLAYTLQETSSYLVKGRTRGLFWEQDIRIQNPDYKEQCLIDAEDREGILLKALEEEVEVEVVEEEDKDKDIPRVVPKEEEKIIPLLPEPKKENKLPVVEGTVLPSSELTFMELVEKGVAETSGYHSIEFYSTNTIKDHDQIHSMTLARNTLYVYVKSLTQALSDSLHEILDLEPEEERIKFIAIK